MAISPQGSVEVIEEVSQVCPPPGSVPTSSLPLTFLDIMFLGSPRGGVGGIFFYDFQFPTSHFMQTTLPNLKTSLSLTLQLFFPFAGNLVFPPPPQLPYILYTENDSVSFLVTESKADFNHLIGNHAQHYLEFQAFVPELPPASTASGITGSGCMQEPLMAIQVTVFPNLGISIGIAFSHIAADGRTVAHFMKSWASIHWSQGDLTCLDNNLPCFNRDLIKGLATSFFTEDVSKFRNSSNNIIPVHRLWVTYSIKHSQVKLLKYLVKEKCMEPTRMSTFVVTCAYMWVCLIKFQQSSATQHPTLTDDSNALSYFHFSADCRDHLKLPATYFSNCLIFRFISAKKSELIGENGILVAATAIAREIMEFSKAPFERVETSLSKLKELLQMRKDVILLSGSPKFGFYYTDFGWGRPIKTAVANNNASLGSLFMLYIGDSREEEGGVEFRLGLAPHELSRFNAIFHHGSSKL